MFKVVLLTISLLANTFSVKPAIVQEVTNEEVVVEIGGDLYAYYGDTREEEVTVVFCGNAIITAF